MMCVFGCCFSCWQRQDLFKQMRHAVGYRSHRDDNFTNPIYGKKEHGNQQQGKTIPKRSRMRVGESLSCQILWR